MIRRLPFELFHQFDGSSLLALNAIRVDRVQKIDGLSADEFVQDADAAVEVGAELAGEGSVVERLRKLAPGNFAFGDQDQAAHVAASGVGRH